MSDCECLPNCPFFFDKLANMPSMSEILKDRYCKGDNLMCARHQVFKVLGSAKVPADLFPNQTERVGEILAGG